MYTRNKVMYTRKDVKKNKDGHFICGLSEYVYENGSIYELSDNKKILVGCPNGRSIKTAIANIYNLSIYQ